MFELLDSYFCDIVQGFMGLARPIDYEEEKQNRSSVNFTYHYLYIFLHMNVLTKLVESRVTCPKAGYVTVNVCGTSICYVSALMCMSL